MEGGQLKTKMQFCKLQNYKFVIIQKCFVVCFCLVFVFLKMGGSIDRITVLPIDVQENHQLSDMFDDVDVSACKCFKEADRHRLLGIIEHGKMQHKNEMFKF